MGLFGSSKKEEKGKALEEKAAEEGIIIGEPSEPYYTPFEIKKVIGVNKEDAETRLILYAKSNSITHITNVKGEEKKGGLNTMLYFISATGYTRKG